MAASAIPLLGRFQTVEPKPVEEVPLKYTDFSANYQLPQVASQGGYP